MEGKMSTWSIVQWTIKLPQWTQYYLLLLDCNLVQWLWRLSEYCWAQWDKKHQKALEGVIGPSVPYPLRQGQLTISSEACSGGNTHLWCQNTPRNIVLPHKEQVHLIHVKMKSFSSCGCWNTLGTLFCIWGISVLNTCENKICQQVMVLKYSVEDCFALKGICALNTSENEEFQQLLELKYFGE